MGFLAGRISCWDLGANGIRDCCKYFWEQRTGELGRIWCNPLFRFFFFFITPYGLVL